jgi:hypothetical protein
VTRKSATGWAPCNGLESTRCKFDGKNTNNFKACPGYNGYHGLGGKIAYTRGRIMRITCNVHMRNVHMCVSSVRT